MPVSSGTTLSGMLGTLGLALVFSNNPVSDAKETLVKLATAYGRPDLRIVCVSSFILIEDPGENPGEDSSQTSVFPANDMGMLRLDQAGELQDLVNRTIRDTPPPDEVVNELKGITEKPARFGFWMTLLGHMLLTVGFGLVMNPTYNSLPVYVVLGLVVGVIVILGSRVRTLALMLPVVAAFVATAVVGIAINAGLIKVDAMLLLAPAVVILLPGFSLVLATIELTANQLISGSSRLLYGLAQLAMLAFGVFLGITVFHIQLDTATGGAERMGRWAPWVGIILVGLGYYLYSVAPKRSLLWVIYALAVAYAGQLLGGLLVGSTLSGLFGAMIAIPLIYLVSHLPTSPPAAVMLPCAYWVLVPGSMGFIGMTEVASGSSHATNVLVQTFGAIIAIAIGMVVGVGFSRDTGMLARAWRRSSNDPAQDPLSHPLQAPHKRLRTHFGRGRHGEHSDHDSRGQE